MDSEAAKLLPKTRYKETVETVGGKAQRVCQRRAKIVEIHGAIPPQNPATPVPSVSFNVS